MERVVDMNHLVPVNDHERVDRLYGYDILDTATEETFRNVAETAAMVFKSSIGLISFVDKDRVFFKESFGANFAGTSVRRDQSLCSVVILNDGVTVYEDLWKDPCKFIQPEIINNAGLRFYAGTPIRSSDGLNIGALAVADRELREVTPAQERILQNLARVVNDELNLRKVSLRHISHLTTAVDRKNELLAHTREELDKSQRELDNFLYRASHDLKGPLATMAGLLNLARREIPDLDSQNYFGKLETVNTRMSESLNKLVVIYSLIRDNEKADDYKILKKTDLVTLLAKILRSFRSRITQKKIQVLTSVDDGISIYISEQYLQLIIINLIENAIYFHHRNGDRHLQISISFEVEQHEMVFRIRDNGPGIPEEYKSKIFDLFFRGHNSARSGMGLYIVKRLVEKAGGRIRMDSRYDDYTEFSVTFSS